ncbi:MAG: hypothetical protein H7268_07950 [Sandarakinorhabdus sp.]|nr:hypothetical protein [Sandarakinorhabdus sp.]
MAALGAVEARLLWAIRRLALMQPIGAARCHSVHIALQQDFGDAGMGIEHLLRCILVGLSRVANRQLVVGTPGCGLLLPDEAALLAVIEGNAGRTALVAVAGCAEAAGLVPLFDAVAALVRK